MEAAFFAFWIAWSRISKVRRNLYISFAVVLNEMLRIEMKPSKVHPESPFGKIVLKMWEDKLLVKSYFKGEVSKEDLKAKGIKFVNPL